MSRFASLAAALVLASASAPGAAAAHDDHSQHQLAAEHKTPYTRQAEEVELPEVTLVDQNGQPVRLASLLEWDGIVAVNFLFATCTTVCPITSASFSDLQKRLGEKAARVRLVSITIDPEHDTPAVLRAYAVRFQAGANWTFLTGDRADIERVTRAFDSYVASKMSHVPRTFLHGPGAAGWVRIDGFMSGAEQLAEFVRLEP